MNKSDFRQNVQIQTTESSRMNESGECISACRRRGTRNELSGKKTDSGRNSGKLHPQHRRSNPGWPGESFRFTNRARLLLARSAFFKQGEAYDRNEKKTCGAGACDAARRAPCRTGRLRKLRHSRAASPAKQTQHINAATSRARARNARSGRVRRGLGSGFGMAGTSLSNGMYAPVCRAYD